MEKEIIIRQSLNANDATKATLQILFSSKLKFFAAIIVAAMIINICSKINFDDPISYTDLLPFLIFLAAPFLFILGIRKAVKNKIENFNNITYTINESSIKTEGGNFFRIYNWEKLIKIRKIKKWYLIYVGNAEAMVIDRSQLDPWQEDGINDLFASIKNKIK